MAVARPTESIRATVIVPAYRAWSTLPLVLSALAPQLAAEHEVVLVNSGIGEADARARHERNGAAERWPWLRIIDIDARLSPAAARNLGRTQARGELLAFLDADAVPCADWLAELEQRLGPGVDAVAGCIVNGTPRSAIGTAEYLLTCSESLPRCPRRVRHAPGANLLVRRECFDSAGGFREDMQTGEDTVLTFQIAGQRRLAFAPQACVRHLNRTRLAPFLRNQHRQGEGFVAICRLVRYPHRWVCRGPAIILAGPLRLLALARCIAVNPGLAGTALRSLPQLVLGTAAWVLGARREQARGGSI